jgi:hypothetical protein
MKTLDFSPKASQRNLPGPLDRVVSALQFGQAWSQDQRSQEQVETPLQRALDNKFTLLRNVRLEGLNVPIPLILVGPPGVRVIYASASPGVFRARGDVWEKMDDTRKEFEPHKPNLLTRTLLIARAVEAFLTSRGLRLPEVEPVLAFTDPGTHVETVRPAVRIVLADAIERFTGGLLQTRSALNQEEVLRVIELLAGAQANQAVQAVQSEPQDAFSFRDEQLPPPRRPLVPERISSADPLTPLAKKVRFSGRQLLLLGLLIGLNLIILISFVVYLVFLN